MEHVDRHKKTLGILFICYAALKIILFTLGMQLVTVALEFIQDEAEVKFAAYIARYVVGTIVILYTLPSIIAGFGLINKKRWALVLALILGVMSLPVFPLGTGIGVYAIIVFLMDQSDYYKKETAPENPVQSIEES